MNNCLQCGAELKLIPAGTSKKTGRAYGAFYSCPSGHRQPPIQQNQQPTYVKEEKVDWDSIAKGKVRHGLVCAMIEKGWDYDRIKAELPAFVDLIILDKPPF